VPEAVGDERLQALQALIRAQQDRFNADSVGLSMPVLFTGRGRKPGQLSGRSPYLQAVHAVGPETLIGTVAMVKIEEMLTNSLTATLSLPSNPLLERACA
jgi:tRNA-2-methylthio-N6-dimethylallyladenosine synthase